jgi:hypothetical protein
MTTTVDVLIYGSTPAGIMTAVAAARHGASAALLSQRAHIGGMCSGGLGQTDLGSCPDRVGGLALEFFKRSGGMYNRTQPRAPWNLEPHVAKRVFLNMLHEAGVTLLAPAQVESVRMEGTTIRSIVTTSGVTHTARVFVDASYEGDLMARTGRVTSVWGREGRSQYNESGAGSQGIANIPYGGVWGDVQPFDTDGRLLPLLSPGLPSPPGTADRLVQAYNFRLCVTNDPNLRVPFAEPPGYNASRWVALRRFWQAWPQSTSPHKEAQAKAPSAILGEIPSSVMGARKFDMNNCGYNPIHTDMVGGSDAYPNASYTERDRIWQEHVAYVQGYLWFMSTDTSVPSATRTAFANDWGLCGDEFKDTAHFPPQLYVREARRMVGDEVFRQNDVGARPLGPKSIGMGCYNFDSHCTKRYACTGPECTQYARPYAAWECGVNVPNPGRYQMPVSLLLPKRSEATNLLVPVCSSASHVAYATVRMEPQFMIAGHSTGVLAALACKAVPRNSSTLPVVQDVDHVELNAALIADGQILSHDQDAHIIV